ncbi:hypothetical protein Ddc_14804 [Ditylenchus destructor]|nr:hypothetical protein Ddc_14804 [Ditylenchus destructor]
MTGQIRSLFVTLSIILAGIDCFYVYLGHISVVNVVAVNPKIRLIDDHSYLPGTDESKDFNNFLQGNLTALKSLMGYELGFDISHLFIRHDSGALLEVRNDHHLKSLDYKRLTYFACKAIMHASEESFLECY